MDKSIYIEASENKGYILRIGNVEIHCKDMDEVMDKLEEYEARCDA